MNIDGTPVSVPNGDDIASLGVGFFCMSIGPANLHIGGLRSRNGVAEHTNMVTRHIPVGSLVTLKYLESHNPPPPLNHERLLEDIEKWREDYDQLLERNPVVHQPPQPKHAVSLHTRTFEVRTPAQSVRASAALDEDAQLQANVYWADGSCTFRVQSVFVQEDGSTTGETFVAIDLQPQQQVEVALVT